MPLNNKLLLALCAFASLRCAGGTTKATLVISDVTVVDVEHGTLLPHRRVVIRGNRIERIDSAPDSRLPNNAQTVDGTDRYLLPSLWDMHVHISEERATAAQLLGWGITGARDMGSDPGEITRLRDSIRSGAVPGPRLMIAGPELRGPREPADSGLNVIRTPADGRRVVDSLATLGVDFIKVHEDLTPEAWFAIARAARAHGLPLVGHVTAALTPEIEADSGIRGIEHLEFVPDPCLVLFDSTTRANSLLLPDECQPSRMELLLQHLQQRGVWLDPTIGSFRIWAPRQFPSIVAGFADLAVLIRKAGLPILAGTDLGSAGMKPGEVLHDELELLVRAGYSPAEAVRAATCNPAVFLGLADSLGQVKPNYVADLLLLEGDPLSDIHNTRRIAAVVQGGHLLSSAELDSLRH